MSSLCIVPARGGSKRLPGKNSKLLGGKPLVFHTLDKVIDVFSKVIFSSDDNELIDLVRNEYKSTVSIHNRKSALASDTSKVIDTIKAIYEKESGFESIWLSLPTCPFKTAEDFNSCRMTLQNSHVFNSVVSITDFDFPPSLALSVGEGTCSIYSTCPSRPWEMGHSRSQDHRHCYRPNGAIYGCKWSRFTGNWYLGGHTFGYYMPPEYSVDIDTEFDFKFAEFLIQENEKKDNGS